MCIPSRFKKILFSAALMLMCSASFADENLFEKGRQFQRDGKYDEAVDAYKDFLTQAVNEDDVIDKELVLYSEALVQMMNAYQAKGEPVACISALREVFNASSVLRSQCLRDYYSVLGYALSRTEKMTEAEQTMLKAFTMPLNFPTPERYFRDYAYAAAVFYSNLDYQSEVINWCKEALHQAQLCRNASGKQWVMAMLGSLYKRNGDFNHALELFLQSKEDALTRNDDLGVLNSLHAMTDLFLYWHVPEYANMLSSEALQVERNMIEKNPMVSAQTYINKGRSLYQLGVADSVSFYIEQARDLCQSLPYNSGMVDVNLLNGVLLTHMGGESVYSGILELQDVIRQGTAVNRAKAYHQLAQTYLTQGEDNLADKMLDSLYLLLNRNDSPVYINLEYQPILEHYLKNRNQGKVEQYVRMMLLEQQAFKKKRVAYNLVESIVDLQTEKKRQELEIMQLRHTTQRLWLIFSIAISVIIISVVLSLLLYQKKQHMNHMRKADEKLALLVQKLNESNLEKEMVAQEIQDFLKDKNRRQELETLTPFILKEDGEFKFRQCFELLYPLFLHRLREKVPSVSRREELLSMLIVLKQDNKQIADLLAIAPRSVLMLRHRFRQKIGMATEYSLENFIEDTLSQNNNSIEEESL